MKAMEALQRAMAALHSAGLATDAETLRDRLERAQRDIATAASDVFAVLETARAPLAPNAADYGDCPPCPACEAPVGVAHNQGGEALPSPLLYCPGCGHRWFGTATERAQAEGADAEWQRLVTS